MLIGPQALTGVASMLPSHQELVSDPLHSTQCSHFLQWQEHCVEWFWEDGPVLATQTCTSLLRILLNHCFLTRQTAQSLLSNSSQQPGLSGRTCLFIPTSQITQLSFNGSSVVIPCWPSPLKRDSGLIAPTQCLGPAQPLYSMVISSKPKYRDPL